MQSDIQNKMSFITLTLGEWLLWERYFQEALELNYITQKQHDKLYQIVKHNRFEAYKIGSNTSTLLINLLYNLLKNK